jgi:hypothetical protein
MEPLGAIARSAGAPGSIRTNTPVSFSTIQELRPAPAGEKVRFCHECRNHVSPGHFALKLFLIIAEHKSCECLASTCTDSLLGRRKVLHILRCRARHLPVSTYKKRGKTGNSCRGRRISGNTSPPPPPWDSSELADCAGFQRRR